MADGNNRLIKYTTEIPIFDTQELHDPLYMIVTTISLSLHQSLVSRRGMYAMNVQIAFYYTLINFNSSRQFKEISNNDRKVGFKRK